MTFTAVHEGRRPYKCDLCDKSFYGKRRLNYHIQSVHEKKIVKFEFSTLSDRLSNDENDSMKGQHFELKIENPLDCEICNKSFAERANLTKHILEVHERKRRFQCKICSRPFARKVDVKRHALGMVV